MLWDDGRGRRREIWPRVDEAAKLKWNKMYLACSASRRRACLENFVFRLLRGEIKPGHWPINQSLFDSSNC